MQSSTPPQQILGPIMVLLLLAISSFTFRESTKTAQSWGAFAAEGRPQVSFLIQLGTSLVLIALIPMVGVVFFWREVELLQLTRRNIVPTLGLILIWGIFPRGTMHLWSLIATSLQRLSGARWTNVNAHRPPFWYSVQAVLAYFLLPLFLYWTLLPPDKWWPSSSRDVWLRLLFIAYTAEMITLVQIGATHHYFTTKEHWLLSIRMTLSAIWTVLLPMIFGAGALALVSGYRLCDVASRPWLFPEAPLALDGITSFVVILLFMSMPYGFNQTWLLFAKRWPDQEKYIAEGNPWWWKMCFAFIGGPLILAVLIWCFDC